MTTLNKLILSAACATLLTTTSSCKVWNNMFGPKYGCPGNGKAYGAERILSGEKPPKTKKFKS